MIIVLIMCPGDPFYIVRAPEQMGGRRLVRTNRAPVQGGDDARRDGLLLGPGRSRMSPKIHPQPARRGAFRDLSSDLMTWHFR
jgi:hypothetical protein